MGGRGTTNFLLAIIAAVLLFGGSAVLGVLQWAFWVGAGLVALYLLIRCILGAISFVRDTIVETRAATLETKAVTLFGLLIVPIISFFWVYVGALWLSGEPHALRATLADWPGAIAIGAFLLGFVGGAVIAIAHALQWIIERREYIPAFFRFSLAMAIRSPLAPVLLPAYLWKVARRRNEGFFISAIEALLGLVVGLVVLLVLTVFALATYQAFSA